MESKTVFVTGASGYIGTWITRRLLEKNYHVKAGVRDIHDEAKVGHLKTMFPEKADHLTLVQIDVDKNIGLEDAIKGCTYIIHTALLESWYSPPELFVNGVKLIEYAPKYSIKRVVLTASMTTICGNQRKENPNHVWTSEDRNTNPESAYSKGKTAAENFCWDFVHEHPEIELVTIHPTFVLGPSLSKRLTSSSEIWFNICDGTAKAKGGVEAISWGLVDVRDIADAHVAAMEKPEAKNQRYLCTSVSSYTTLDWINMVKDKYPNFQWPNNIKNNVQVKNNGS